MKPLKELIITQPFGVRSEYYGLGGHPGVDFRTKGLGNGFWNNLMGYQPCFAVADGKLKVFYGNKGYGNHIYLDTPQGSFLYAHLKNARGFTGLSVKEGDIIGITGNTGNSTAAHLHFGYKINSIFVNPMPLFENPMQPLNYKIIYLSDTDDLAEAIAYCNDKFKEFTNGLLGVEYSFKQIARIDAPPGFDLDQFQAMQIVDAQILPPVHGVVLGHYGSNSSQGYSTHATPKNRVMTQGYKPFPKEALLFELKHQAILWYDMHRESRPFMGIKDASTGGIDIVKSQLQSLIPYIGIFNLE